MKDLKPIPEPLGAGDHVLELVSVFHSGPVEPGTWFQKLISSVPTGTVLKDVSTEIHAGEVMAVLGSKGSGKRALLEVVSRRAAGVTRGQILLNDLSVSLHMFQEQCGFTGKQRRLLPGLTVRQTLHYAAHLTLGSKVSNSIKKSRVKQVIGDLALSQVANREVSHLKLSEYRRLIVALELVKDPVLLLLDEPTCGLDPLNTYFLVSILSHHAKKYQRMVVLTMEKPRSDIFPFLDRVTYLSLGEVVYTGSTRMLLDYFGSIGFPCPELENPLMYYLCLSTVDRRTRERFIESSTQISALVDKYKAEGTHYRKYPSSDAPLDPKDAARYKLPLTAYGQPSAFQVFITLLSRRLCLLLNCTGGSAREMFLRLLLLPLAAAILVCFYLQLGDTQQGFQSRENLLLNCLLATSCLSAVATAVSHAPHRNRYYQESREGLYKGHLFILSSLCYGLPLSAITVTAASAIIYTGAGLREDWAKWGAFCAALWAVYVFAEQQTIALMMVVRSSFAAAAASIYILLIYIVFASGTVRTLSGLHEWVNYLSYAVVYRYAGVFLHQNEFLDNERLDRAPTINGTEALSCSTNVPGRCVWVDGQHYLAVRYGADMDSDYWMNLGVCFAFALGMGFLNAVLHLIPLPAFLKAKFRD